MLAMVSLVKATASRSPIDSTKRQACDIIPAEWGQAGAGELPASEQPSGSGACNAAAQPLRAMSHVHRTSY